MLQVVEDFCKNISTQSNQVAVFSEVSELIVLWGEQGIIVLWGKQGLIVSWGKTGLF